MSVYPSVVTAYRDYGYHVVSGLNPLFANDSVLSEYTWIIDEAGDVVTDGLGISLQEVLVIESLLEVVEPRTCLVIGNALGYSTMVIGFACPSAHVVALDSGDDDNSEWGIEVTNQLAQRSGLDVRAVLGRSPQDVPNAVGQLPGAGSEVDLVLIDGGHTVDQLALDLRAVLPFLSAHGVVVAHDVRFWDLGDAIAQVLGDDESLWARNLTLTTSGMAVVSRSSKPALHEVCAAFTGDSRAVAAVAREGLAHQGVAASEQHRRLRESLRS